MNNTRRAGMREQRLVAVATFSRETAASPAPPKERPRVRVRHVNRRRRLDAQLTYIALVALRLIIRGRRDRASFPSLAGKGQSTFAHTAHS